MANGQEPIPDTESAQAAPAVEAVVRAAPAQPTPTLADVDLRLIPDEIEVLLSPRAGGPGPERLRSLWHLVSPRSSALISLTSRDKRIRIVRLSLRSSAAYWRGKWTRWVLVVRRPPELMGGDAIAAQDVLSEDETAITLLLLPGERREVSLELHAELEGETPAGDYPFEVVAEDVEIGATDTAAGLLRLRHPPPNLASFLPAIYREAASAQETVGLQYEDPPFFARYLCGFEDAWTPIQGALDSMHQLFGAMTTPPDFLPWLATWVSLTLDENWPELKRRRLIKEAIHLYQWRGTRYGLSRYLEIYTGLTPEINDQPFVGMRLGPTTLLGCDTVLGDVPPHTFVVTLALPPAVNVNERTARDIIEAEKPAHTAYRLRIVRRTTSDHGS